VIESNAVIGDLNRLKMINCLFQLVLVNIMIDVAAKVTEAKNMDQQP